MTGWLRETHFVVWEAGLFMRFSPWDLEPGDVAEALQKGRITYGWEQGHMRETDTLSNAYQETIGEIEKRRKQFLHAFILIMVIDYFFPAVQYLLVGQISAQTLSINSPPTLVFPLFGMFSLLNIVFLAALFRRKKWGPWGLLVAFVPTVFLKYRIHMSISAASLEIIGTLVIFCLLLMGKTSVCSKNK
jgi:hypothetical protein